MNNFSKFKKASISKSEMNVVKGGRGTCGYYFNGEAYYGVSKGDAQSMMDVGASNWCCDSCSKASWMPSGLLDDSTPVITDFN